MAKEDTPEKPTLMTLLAAFAAADAEVAALNLDPEIDLLDASKMKIDGYKYVLDKLRAQEFYLAERVAEFDKALSTVKGLQKSIKGHLLFAMQTHKFEKFTGHEWTVKVKQNPPKIVVADSKPDMYAKSKWGDYVRTKYEWDKKLIKKDFDKNPELAALATLERGSSIQFSITKDVFHEFNEASDSQGFSEDADEE